jgi:uncharacterized protein with PIN domain
VKSDTGNFDGVVGHEEYSNAQPKAGRTVHNIIQMATSIIGSVMGAKQARASAHTFQVYGKNNNSKVMLDVGSQTQ